MNLVIIIGIIIICIFAIITFVSVQELRHLIEDFNELIEEKQIEDLSEKSMKLKKIGWLLEENSNGSVENLKNKIKTIIGK